MKRGGDSGAPAAKRGRGNDDGNDDMRNLIVNYLPETVDDGTLRTMFEQLGEVERAKVMTDKDSGASRCFGFVKYVSAESAQAAIDNLNGIDLGGKKLKVRHADNNRSKQAPATATKVYFSGFGTKFEDAHLRQLCEGYGPVFDTKVLDSSTHQFGKGVGFCTFNLASDAHACIQHLDGLDFDVNEQKGKLTVRLAKENARDAPPRGAGRGPPPGAGAPPGGMGMPPVGGMPGIGGGLRMPPAMPGMPGMQGMPGGGMGGGAGQDPMQMMQALSAMMGAAVSAGQQQQQQQQQGGGMMGWGGMGGGGMPGMPGAMPGSVPGMIAPLPGVPPPPPGGGGAPGQSANPAAMLSSMTQLLGMMAQGGQQR